MKPLNERQCRIDHLRNIAAICIKAHAIFQQCSVLTAMAKLPRSDSTTAGTFMVLLAAASWGTWSAFLRPTNLPATVTGPIVFLVMSVATLPWCFRAAPVQWQRRTVLLLLAHGLFDALNVLAYFSAIERTSAAVAVLTHYLAPCIIALLTPLIDKQKSPGARTATVAALIGLLLVLAPWQSAGPGQPAPLCMGAVFGALSAFCYAGNVFVVRRLATEIGTARAISYHSLIAAALLIPFGARQIGMVTTDSLLRLLIAALTIGAGSGALFVSGLRRIDSGRAAVLTYAEPLVAVAIGAIWYREPFGALAFAGSVIIAGAGIYITTRSN
jgi:drug/metabolite transporter, DME family